MDRTFDRVRVVSWLKGSVCAEGECLGDYTGEKGLMTGGQLAVGALGAG